MLCYAMQVRYAMHGLLYAVRCAPSLRRRPLLPGAVFGVRADRSDAERPSCGIAAGAQRKRGPTEMSGLFERGCLRDDQ